MIFVLNRNELKNFLKKNNKNFFLLNLSNDECINKNILILAGIISNFNPIIFYMIF